MNEWALAGLALVLIVTFYLGRRPTAEVTETQDFLSARRTVRSRRNAAAISGEFLCAASFLGIAGAVMVDGADALWYPVGFCAGFLALMIFVAAPLRRTGAYTLPDFVQARLSTTGVRMMANLVVVLTAVLYIVPQLQGAGMTLNAVVPGPMWLGGAVVTVIAAVQVIAGGMRAMTLSQAFQYWLKLFAIAAPTLVLFVVFAGGWGGESSGRLSQEMPPVFAKDTTVTVRTPVTLEVATKTTLTAKGTVEGAPVDGRATWGPDEGHPVGAGTVLRFEAGTPVPTVSGSPTGNADWLVPSDRSTFGLLGTYSLLLALALGTMALPHIPVRFYTNPDGKAARRTTLHVVVLLGLFYLFPALLGAIGRLYVPELLATGNSDAVVLLLPSAMLAGPAGQVVTAIVVAGAFSAFLAACSGLLFSIAAVVSSDLLPGKLRNFRFATVLVAALTLGLTLLPRTMDLTTSVGIAFALAASTLAPVLVLGIWWRGLTSRGAVAGMMVGTLIVLAGLALHIVSTRTGGWAPDLARQPALISVPLAFLTTIVVSAATKRSIPANINALMLRMHAPDRLGFVRDREIPRYGLAEERLRLASGRHRRD